MECRSAPALHPPRCRSSVRACTGLGLATAKLSQAKLSQASMHLRHRWHNSPSAYYSYYYHPASNLPMRITHGRIRAHAPINTQRASTQAPFHPGRAAFSKTRAAPTCR